MGASTPRRCLLHMRQGALHRFMRIGSMPCERAMKLFGAGRCGWCLSRIVLPLCVLLLACSLWRLHMSERRTERPQEGYYWSISQLQMAFFRLREELRALHAGAPLNRELLCRRVGNLLSRVALLREPSELTAALRQVDGFEQGLAEMETIVATVAPLVERSDITSAEVADTLKDLIAFEDRMTALTALLREAELRERDAQFEAVKHRQAEVNLAAIVLAIFGSALIVLQWLSARELRSALAAKSAAVADMEAAIASKTRFLGMVSHELRSPLQTILSSVDLLGLEVAEHDRATALGRIRRACLALRVQLTDLLTLARAEAGKLELRPEPFEATDLVLGVAEMVAQSAEAKGLVVHRQVPTDPIFAVADATRVWQILANLVGNAVKYTTQGEVVIGLEPVSPADGRLVFHVSDTGPGIPADRLAAAFQPFERVGQWGRTDDGAGIGLAVVDMLLQHLGGTIAIQQRPQEQAGGTHFRVVIPAVIQEPGEVPGDSADRHTTQLLVVDDQEDVRDALHQLATALGYACDLAASAAMAANCMAAKAYDVVLIDLEMPLKNGETLARELRRSTSPSANAFLIAMSANDAALRNEPSPFDLYLEKPIDQRRLKQAIGRQREVR